MGRAARSPDPGVGVVADRAEVLDDSGHDRRLRSTQRLDQSVRPGLPLPLPRRAQVFHPPLLGVHSALGRPLGPHAHQRRRVPPTTTRTTAAITPVRPGCRLAHLIARSAGAIGAGGDRPAGEEADPGPRSGPPRWRIAGPGSFRRAASEQIVSRSRGMRGWSRRGGTGSAVPTRMSVAERDRHVEANPPVPASVAQDHPEAVHAGRQAISLAAPSPAPGDMDAGAPIMP